MSCGGILPHGELRSGEIIYVISLLKSCKSFIVRFTIFVLYEPNVRPCIFRSKGSRETPFQVVLMLTPHVRFAVEKGKISGILGFPQKPVAADVHWAA